MAGSSSRIHTGRTLLRIAIDFGAASSAVAYHKLVKDQVIEAPQSIQTYPGAPNAADAKVPTAILYRGKTAIAFGFEAEKHLEGRDKGYLLVRNLKLALHPEYMAENARNAAVDLEDELYTEKHGERDSKLILPEGVKAQQAVTDYLRWLCMHTRSCFIRHHDGGEALWKALIGSAEFIMGAPNGWSPQQTEILKRCLKGSNYCHDSNKIRVVSEGEASLHHVLNIRARPLTLKDKEIFVVCDAGGSTIDITAYKCVDAVNVLVEEVGGAALCLLRGGIFLSKHLRKSVAKVFAALPKHFDYDRPENVDAVMMSFERDVKNQYTVDSNDMCFLAFTHPNTPNDQRGSYIVNGKIGIEGAAFKKAFEYSAGGMIAYLHKKIEAAKEEGPVKCIILVGGLGDSPYIYKRLEQEFAKMNVGVINAPYDMPGAKAVSIGASWYALNSNTVVRRAALFHYGYSICEDYDEKDPLHAGHYTHRHADGEHVVANRFGLAIKKGTLSTPGEFKWHSLYQQSHESSIKSLCTTLFASTAEVLPHWTSASHKCGSREYNKDILALGEVKYSGPSIPFKRVRGSSGEFSQCHYQLGVSFGGAEIVCQMRDADTKKLIGPQFTFAAIPAELS